MEDNRLPIICDTQGLPVKGLSELPEIIAAGVKRISEPAEYQFLSLFADGDLMVTMEEGYMKVFIAKGKKWLFCMPHLTAYLRICAEGKNESSCPRRAADAM